MAAFSTPWPPGSIQGWEKAPAKNRQKDNDARWTKKHGKSFFGYKKHVNVDAKHKRIRHYEVSNTAVHDSQKLDGLLNTGTTLQEVFADSAYRSAATEAKLKARGFKSRIHVRAARSSALEGQRDGEPEEEPDSRLRRVRLRRSADLAGWPDRADDRHRPSQTKIGLQNLVYNIRRLVTLDRMAAA